MATLTTKTTTKVSALTNEWNEAADLYDLLTSFYDHSEDLKNLEKELEELQANPVTYQNETDVDALQLVINYLVDVIDLKDRLAEEGPETITELTKLQNEVVAIFKELGVPQTKRITVNYEGANINFWVDEEGYLGYEEV